MIAVDTNLLVYAHREDSAHHPRAATCLAELATGNEPWAIAWPCVHEFLAIVTHPKIYNPPTPLPRALDQIAAWLESPSLVLLGEARDHFAVLREMLLKSKVTGPRIHDARVAAVCRSHGVREILTADRDFSRFSSLRSRNPLAD